MNVTTTPISVSNAKLELATFHVGDLLVGADIRQVEEINRYLEVTPLPHAQKCILGVLNLRGNVVTIVDLRTILGLEPVSDNRRSHIVIVRYEDERVGLVVDHIADVVQVSADQIDEVPANVNTIDSRFLRGVHAMKDDLLMILDVAEALTL